MEHDFRDRVVVVTGASSGIGRAAAEHFARAGALIGIFSRSEHRLASLASEHPASMIAVAGDVSQEADVSRLFDAVEERFGDCDILVNCAGVIEPHRLHQTTPEVWDHTFSVNVRGTFLTMRRALPSMMARRSGAIVNVSSISGVPGPQKFPGFVPYCASKAAVIAMTEATAVEVSTMGIRVNCVSPGSVDTPMWAAVSGGAPAKMTPAEVAASIAFLASDSSRPMNGQNIWLW